MIAPLADRAPTGWSPATNYLPKTIQGMAAAAAGMTPLEGTVVVNGKTIHCVVYHGPEKGVSQPPLAPEKQQTNDEQQGVNQ